MIRRPQMGIPEAEKEALLDSYRALKKSDFRREEQTARRQALA
jgi:hypothetical protein